MTQYAHEKGLVTDGLGATEEAVDLALYAGQLVELEASGDLFFGWGPPGTTPGAFLKGVSSSTTGIEVGAAAVIPARTSLRVRIDPRWPVLVWRAQQGNVDARVLILSGEKTT
jgi:hypothetical protein